MTARRKLSPDRSRAQHHQRRVNKGVIRATQRWASSYRWGDCIGDDGVLMTTSEENTAEANTEKESPVRQHRDRTHWLYIAVIVAVVAGVILGLLAPSVGKNLAILGEMFV